MTHSAMVFYDLTWTNLFKALGRQSQQRDETATHSATFRGNLYSGGFSLGNKIGNNGTTVVAT